jgi:hypothetical protein
MRGLPCVIFDTGSDRSLHWHEWWMTRILDFSTYVGLPASLLAATHVYMSVLFASKLLWCGGSAGQIAVAVT